MTGKVEYLFFDKNLNPWASVCDGQPRLTEQKNVGEESSDHGNLPPGQYAFRARYSGTPTTCRRGVAVNRSRSCRTTR